MVPMVAFDGARAPGRRLSRPTWIFCVKFSSRRRGRRLPAGGGSVCSVFERFSDLLTLSLAAADYAFEQATAQAAVPNVDADLHIRLKSQVETRVAICEEWLPLWRALLHYKDESEELAIRIKRIRAAMVSRLELVYGPELSTLSEAERTQLLVALDILTDFESWDGW